MLVGSLIAAALVVLAGLHLHETKQEKRRRGELFADAQALFDAYMITQEEAHFPILDGRYRGHHVLLTPVLDDMGVRKIPSLWLKVTLLSSNPERGTLDFIVRPQGTEFYSPSDSLPKKLAIPATWPQHAALSTDGAGKMPAFDRLTPHIGIFQDARMKELLVTPRGVRLVYQAAQARRSEYLVLRQSRFGDRRLDPGVVRALLDRAIAVAHDLDKPHVAPAETMAA